MNTQAPVPQYVYDAIATLEASARQHETAAGELRDAITVIRREFGVSTLTPLPAAEPEASAPSPAKPTKDRPTPKRRATPPASKVATPTKVQTKPAAQEKLSSDVDARVEIVFRAVASLRDCRAGEVARVVAKHGVPQHSLKSILGQLITSGRIERSGERAGTRYRLPLTSVATPPAAAKTSGASAPAEDRPTPPSHIDGHQKPSVVVTPDLLQAAVLKILKHGASHTAGEMARALLREGISAQTAAVRTVLEHLTTHRYIARILGAGDTEPRYRQKAA